MMERSEEGLKGLTQKEQNYFRRGRRMALRFSWGPRLFSKSNCALFRLTGGRLGGRLLGVTVGLLTTTGRRSGRSRTVPVVYLDDSSRWLVAASNNGFDVPPAWCLNLQAHPNAELRTRTGTERVAARRLTDSEREAVWPRLLKHNPVAGAYQSCTERQFAVFALERATGPAPLPRHQDLQSVPLHHGLPAARPGPVAAQLPAGPSNSNFAGPGEQAHTVAEDQATIGHGGPLP
ncbi:MAG: nitroreductase/quinone reductase family protein [Acidobacteriaceae bacterium]